MSFSLPPGKDAEPQLMRSSSVWLCPPTPFKSGPGVRHGESWERRGVSRRKGWSRVVVLRETGRLYVFWMHFVVETAAQWRPGCSSLTEPTGPLPRPPIIAILGFGEEVRRLLNHPLWLWGSKLMKYLKSSDERGYHWAGAVSHYSHPF